MHYPIFSLQMIVPNDTDSSECIIGYFHRLFSFVRCELSMFDFLVGIDHSHHYNDQQYMTMHYPISPLQMIVRNDPDALQCIIGYFHWLSSFMTCGLSIFDFLVGIDQSHNPNDHQCIVLNHPIRSLQMIIPNDPNALQCIIRYFHFR